MQSQLEEKPANSHEALVYFCDLLRGLDYVHDAGYLHRDLAKKNIFVGKDGNIKIGDFGLGFQSIILMRHNLHYLPQCNLSLNIITTTY